MSSRDYLQEYAADGDVQVEYRPFNLLTNMPYSERALNAFVAVLEEDPRKALQLHDTLFDNQPYEQTSGSVSVDDIKGWVKDTGVSDDVVQAAGEDHQAWFQAARQAVEDNGVQGTPTVFVDGKQISGQSSVGQMADQLEKIIAENAKAAQ
jgi:protein-disulfide isomerase